MSSIQSFHSAMQTFGASVPGVSFAKVDGAICIVLQSTIVQRALSLFPCFRNERDALTSSELNQEIVGLFHALHPVEPSDVAGLAFCRKQLKGINSPSQAVRDTIGRIETLSSRCSLLFLPPSDVLPMFGNTAALRATCSTIVRRLSVSLLFKGEKILARAIDGDPYTVRKLAGFIALKCQFDELPLAKRCFEAFYSKATPKAKEQFWRVIFCCGHWPQFKKLLPLNSVEELSFKFSSWPFTLFKEQAELIAACPNLVSLTFKEVGVMPVNCSLIDAVMACRKLKSLSIQHKGSFNNALSLKPLAQHPALTSLSFSTPTEYQLEEISSLTNLEELSLGSSVLGYDLPIPNRSVLTRLKKLALVGFWARSDDSATFENLKELEKLSIEKQATGPTLLASICTNKTLQELCLDTNLVSHKRLLQEVITLKSLHTISLFNDQGESMNARFLTTLLQNCPELRSIALHNTLQGTSEEVSELQAALAKATQLEHLSLRCSFSSREFAKTLLGLPKLKSLSFWTEQPLDMIDALKTRGASSNLEKLTFHFPEPGVLEALANLPKLRKVKIRGSYSVEEIKKLASCPALNSITFRDADFGNRFTAEVLSSILQIKTLQKFKVIHSHHDIDLSKALQYIEQADHIRSVTLPAGLGPNYVWPLRAKKLSHLHTLTLSYYMIEGAPDDLLH